MSSVEYRGPIEPASGEPEDLTETSGEERPSYSLREWRTAVDGTPDETPLTVKEAAEQTRKEPPPLIIRKAPEGKKTLSLREAAEDLSFTRKMERGQRLLEQGFSEQEALGIVKNPDADLRVVVYPDPNTGKPVDPRKLPPHESLREAAAELSDMRRAADAERQAALEEIAGRKELAELEQAEQPAAEPQQPQQQPEQPDVAAERQRLQAARQHAEWTRQLTAAEITGRDWLSRATAQIFSDFSDIRSPSDLATLQATQPDRFAALVTAKENIERTRLGLAQVVEQQTQYRRAAAAQQAQAFNSYRQQQAAEFEQRAKRIAPNTWADTRARNDAALNTLRAAGASDQEIARLRSGPGWININAAASQEILLKASLWDHALARAKEVKKAQLPPVQRPGVARPVGASAAERIGKLQGQLANVTGRKALEIGAEIQKLKRGMQ